jgi:hypothetical protein
LHRQAAAWNDEQIIIYLRNALKKEVIDWFDSLPLLNVSQHVWQEIQTRSEIDYKAKARATSIIAKLPEVRQAADETVNNYFSRANKILWELKTNIDPNQIKIPDVVLLADLAKQWTALPKLIWTTVINHYRRHTASRSCEQYNAIILTAGFKPSIKTKIMGANLTVLADIKDLVLNMETLEGEKKTKPNGPNLLINPVEDTPQEIDALRFGNQRGGYRGFRGGSTQYRGQRGGQENYNNATRGNHASNQNRGENCSNHTNSQNQHQAQQAPATQRSSSNGGRGATSGQAANGAVTVACCKIVKTGLAECMRLH